MDTHSNATMFRRPRASGEGDMDLGASWRDLALVLFRRKWSLLTIALVGMMATIVWLWVIRDEQYELTAKVLVKMGYEQAPSSTILTDRPLNVISQRGSDVNSEVDILQNTELLERVIDRLGLDRPAPPPPYPDGAFARARWHAKTLVRRVRDAVDEAFIWAGLRPRLSEREKVLWTLRSGLRVVPQRDSNVFVARMLVPFREGSSVVLNTLLDEYLSFRLRLWKAEGTVDFFRAQVADSERELRAAEDDLRWFEQRHDISLIARQQDVLLMAISDVDAALRAADLELADAKQKVARLDAERRAGNADFAVSGEFDRGSFPENLQVQLSGLLRERERLRMTELDTGPRLQNLKSQIDLLLGQIATYLKSAEAEKQVARDIQAAALARLKGQLQTVHASEIDWNALKRRAKVLEDSYLLYRGKLNEATGVEALETRRIGNVAVVERATDPLRPAGMRKLTLLAIAMAVIACASLAWVVIAGFFDHRIYAADDLERSLNAPVIGVIPAGRVRLPADVPRRTLVVEPV